MKAKKYDWKDSNMALFGSDTEKKVCICFRKDVEGLTAGLFTTAFF